jgi:hypothetical protein
MKAIPRLLSHCFPEIFLNRKHSLPAAHSRPTGKIAPLPFTERKRNLAAKPRASDYQASIMISFFIVNYHYSPVPVLLLLSLFITLFYKAATKE